MPKLVEYDDFVCHLLPPAIAAGGGAVAYLGGGGGKGSVAFKTKVCPETAFNMAKSQKNAAPVGTAGHNYLL